MIFCGGQMLLVRPCWEAQLPPHFPIRKENKRIRSLKLTYPLKIDSWKRRFQFGNIIFRGYVSFRECTIQKVRFQKLPAPFLASPRLVKVNLHQHEICWWKRWVFWAKIYFDCRSWCCELVFSFPVEANSQHPGLHIQQRRTLQVKFFLGNGHKRWQVVKENWRIGGY